MWGCQALSATEAGLRCGLPYGWAVAAQNGAVRWSGLPGPSFPLTVGPEQLLSVQLFIPGDRHNLVYWAVADTQEEALLDRI